jgi:hypothetical protein
MANAEDIKKQKEELLKQVADKTKNGGGNKQQPKKKKQKQKKDKGKGMFKDRRLNIIVNKIGLSEQDANWCIKLHKKYCIWIANQLKENPELKMREGDMLMILDWKKEEQELNLNDYTFETALDEARKAHGIIFKESNNSLKNKNVVLDLGKYKWVQLQTKDDCREEGEAMGHCVGGHSGIWNKKSYAFSLRDEFNRPHLTLEARRENGVIFEFKGRSNRSPKPEYVECYIELSRHFSDILGTITDYSFVNSIGKDIILAQRLNEANARTFDENLKLKLGLDLFKEGETFMQSLMVNHSNKFVLPKDIKIYGNLFVAVGGRVEIPDNIVVGGSVSIHGSQLKIGENLKVGGNFEVAGCSLKDIPKNLQVCGDVFLPIAMKRYEKKIKEQIVCGGRLIFAEPNKAQSKAQQNLANLKYNDDDYYDDYFDDEY